VVLVLVGIGYIKSFYGIHKLFRKLPLPGAVRAMIGAALSSLCGVGLYFAFGRDERVLSVLSTGYGTLQIALEHANRLGPMLLLSVALVKILTTSLTIGSGGSGGVFGPSMVIGGCLGAAVGNILHNIAPGLVRTPEMYAIVGMAGFFAGIAHAPISTIIMVSEMTGDYQLLLPTMWVSTLCFLLCRRWTLYEKQLPSRLDSPAHRGDFLVDVLEGIRVRDIPLKQRETVTESATLHDILQLLPNTRQNYFPVLDRDGRLVGIFSTDDVRSYLYDETIWSLVNGRDLMTTKLVSVTPDDDLNTALRRFTQLNIDEMPVIATNDSKMLVGMLRRKDAISVYNNRLAAQKKIVQDHA
jgi:chloride channel protein, CIC family